MPQPASKAPRILGQLTWAPGRAGIADRSRLQLLLLGAVVCTALLLRLNAGLARDLWEDEIIAATHAEQPFWRLPVEVMRFDIHPFLYFFQLHAWSLISGGDVWLRLNSVAWNLVAIASICLVSARLYGNRTAWITGPLFALSAPVVWMGQELRPYSWLYCLLIWAFYFVERSCRKASGGLGDRAAALGLCICLIYSHALAFFAVFLLGLYAFGRTVQTGITIRALAWWAVLFGTCALAAIPPLLVDLLRDANLSGGGILADLLDWIPRLVMPRGEMPAMVALAGVVFVGAVAAGLAVRETRLMAGIFLVAPIAVAVMLGTANVHMFKPNIFCTIMTPFLVIVLGRVIARAPEPQRSLGAASLGLAFTLFSIAFFADRAPTTGFRAASRLIEAQARPGDIVYVPQQSMFWGMARYMGPGRRAWQLQVAPALTPQWQRMFDRLGPRFVAAFDLAPRTQTLTMPAGPPLLVGTASIGTAASASRVWLVTYARADLPPDYPPAAIGALKPVSTDAMGFLQVRLYR